MLSSGEFAKLGRTTKRTVRWYTQLGLIVPKSVSPKGFRQYSSNQIIDLQMILLLTNLGFSLKEISDLFGKNKNKTLNELLQKQRSKIENEINNLITRYKSVSLFSNNIEKTGTLVNPKFSYRKEFGYFGMEVLGSYDNIKRYCQTLEKEFINIPDSALYLTVFLEHGYKPKKSLMRISLLKKHFVKLKTGSEIQVFRFPEHKALKTRYIGPSKMLSLLWKEVEKYAKNNGFKRRSELPTYEIYISTSMNGNTNDNTHIFDMYYPIE